MIFTFYSFKGGVGRSMALANVAELFYSRGLKVLMVDFDLEAPGLERYFCDKDPDLLEKVQSARGVIDMVISFRELQAYTSTPTSSASADEREAALSAEPLDQFVVQVPRPSTHPGRLDLLPAGHRRNPDFDAYAKRVLNFDWADFYLHGNGGRFFDRFRHELARWDAVLIDSRTGVTELGGVCTHQLADVVVCFVATNQQNLEGTTMMAQSLTREELRRARHGRPIHLLFVPSRVELSEEDRHDEFAARFGAELGAYFPSQLRPEKGWFVDLKLTYVPAYSYMERVAVREADRASKVDLADAYRRLARTMAQLAGAGPLAEAYFEALGTVSNAPPPIPTFIGRNAEIEQLRAALVAGGSAVAICGLGGVGKTSLARAYLSLAQREYRWILWLDGSSAAELEQSLAAVLRLLGIDAEGTGAAARFRTWLESHDDWLLVVDEVVDIPPVEVLLPARPRGRMIFTSRRHLAGLQARLQQVIELSPLPAEESLALFTSRLGRPLTKGAESQAARDLVREFAGHPLSLELAAGSIRSRGSRVQDFLPSYRRRGLSVLDSTGEIASMLTRNLDLLDSSPASRDALNVAVFLGRDVPVGLLTAAAPVLGDHLQGALREAADDPLVVDDLLEPLVNLGLIARNVADHSFQVHPLISELVRESLTPAERDTWRRRACEALALTFRPGNDDDPRIADLLISHVVTLLGSPTSAMDPTEAQLWLRVAQYHAARGSITEAQTELEVAIKTFERLGDHRSLARALHLESQLSGLRGDHQRALRSAERALAVAESESREAVLAQSMMAAELQQLGKSERAIELWRFVVQTAEQLGYQDLQIEAAAHLATALASSGRIEEAEASALQLLDLGEALGGVAFAQAAQTVAGMQMQFAHDKGISPPETVEGLLRRALSTVEDRLGGESPQAVSLLIALGDYYLWRHEFSKALPIYERGVALSEHTAWVSASSVLYHRLALAFSASGNAEQGRHIVERGAARLSEALGPESDTLAEFMAAAKSIPGLLEPNQKRAT